MKWSGSPAGKRADAAVGLRRAKMKDPRKAQVVEGKRKPPFWSVKAGARYVTGFIGNDAKERAIDFARANYADFEIIEKMPRRRKPTPRTGGRRNAT